MTQYYSRIDTEFNGDVYSIPFSYINENEINVYINDELWEDWEFLNASQIKLLELPSDLPANSIITIQRNTNIEEKVVDFTNNTMLSESALDLSNDQFLYSIQEVYDDVSKFKIDIKEEVDKKVEAVSEAAAKINALEEAVVTATDAAQVASEQAEIAVETSTEAKELLNSSLEEIQQQGFQAIEEIYKVGQSIVDTGIHTRATIDLDNISDKAKQDIQYQAKLANAPFCANSGNVDENGNADLLYLPESGFTEIYWQNPVITSLTDYGTLSGEGWTNILQAFDGSTALQRISIHSTTVDWKFPTDKRILLNRVRIFWGGQDAVSGSAHSAYLELYKDGVALTKITIAPIWAGWQDITFDKTECDRVYLYIDGYNYYEVPTRIGEVQFVGTEIIPISTSTQAFFKIGGNYEKLVATSTEKTFERSHLQPVNIEDIDLPYRANYTRIGAVSDNDGLIKGFTTTSYAQIPMTIPFSIADNFEVAIKFTYKETSGVQQTIAAEHNTAYFSGFGINADGYINLYLGNSTHTGKFIEANSAYTPIEEHSYNLKFTFDGTTYRVFIKEESDTEFEEIITEESTERLADFIWNIGCSAYKSYEFPFAGVIDLKETYIKINGQIIWDNLGGAFNVFINDTQQPYTLANTIYRQKSEPTANTNDVWLNTAIQPYKAYKFNGTEWEDFKDVPVGSFVIENRSISSVETFDYNLTFKKVTSNMPSNKYIDLTLGASGSTYTAPANGYFFVMKTVGSDYYYVQMAAKDDNDVVLYQAWDDAYRTSPSALFLPIKKGYKVQISYNATGSTQYFRFIYAEGEE